MLKKWEEKFYGINSYVTIREADCVIYRIKDEWGESTITRYEVALGVALVYNDVHAEKIIVENTSEFHNILEINHCREGRIEFESVGGEYFYIKKGDMAVNTKAGLKEYADFPQCHYHGVTIEFDLDLIQKTPVEFMT